MYFGYRTGFFIKSGEQTTMKNKNEINYQNKVKLWKFSSLVTVAVSPFIRLLHCLLETLLELVGAVCLSVPIGAILTSCESEFGIRCDF